MKLIIVRHGLTEFNEKKIMQGHRDSRLTEKGKIQSEQLAKRLLKEHIDVVYSSDLERCKKTLVPFLKKANIPVHYTKALRERDYGIFEGKPVEEWVSHIRDNRLQGSWEFKPVGGESFPQVTSRMRKQVEEIFEKEKGKTVLVMTHGSAKKALLLSLFEDGITDENYDKYSPENVSISILEFDKEGNPVLKEFNSTGHLDS